jgi:hypothetical protein
MSKPQGSAALCSRKAAMCIVRPWRLYDHPKPHPKGSHVVFTKALVVSSCRATPQEPGLLSQQLIPTDMVGRSYISKVLAFSLIMSIGMRHHRYPHDMKMSSARA